MTSETLQSNISDETQDQALDLAAYERMYDRGEWSCFSCAKWFVRRDNMKSHLVVHYKKELNSKYVTNGAKCTLCDFVAKDSKALLHHIALRKFIRHRGIFSKVLFRFENGGRQRGLSNF